MANRALLQQLRRRAGRYWIAGDDPEDLVQDALLAAHLAGKTDFSSAENLAWLGGTLRNLARDRARRHTRRRRREQDYATSLELHRNDEPPASVVDLNQLPPAQRQVAKLILTGHTRAEIAYLLKITDASLRQRLSALRRHLAAEMAPGDFTYLSHGLDYGRIRHTLRLALKLPLPKATRHLAAHDPDGHLLIISARSSQKPQPRQYRLGNSPKLQEITHDQKSAYRQYLLLGQRHRPHSGLLPKHPRPDA